MLKTEYKFIKTERNENGEGRRGGEKDREDKERERERNAKCDEQRQESCNALPCHCFKVFVATL